MLAQIIKIDHIINYFLKYLVYLQFKINNYGLYEYITIFIFIVFQFLTYIQLY